MFVHLRGVIRNYAVALLLAVAATATTSGTWPLLSRAPLALDFLAVIIDHQRLAELDEICAAIPHDRLAIQWDTAVEFAILEGVWPSFLTGQPNAEAEIVDRLIRIGKRVPADVELGYHLCYGDAGHRHFKEPHDTAKLVSVANAVAAGVDRPRR